MTRLAHTNLNNLEEDSTLDMNCDLKNEDYKLVKTYDFYQPKRNINTGKRVCDYWKIALYKDKTSSYNDYLVGFWGKNKLIWLDSIGIKRNPEHTSYDNINLKPNHINSYWTIEWTDWESLVMALQDEVEFLKEQEREENIN